MAYTKLFKAAIKFHSDAANKAGIILQDHFETPEKFRLGVAAMTIRVLMNEHGKELPEAYDMVFGDGRYEKLFQNVLDHLAGV